MRPSASSPPSATTRNLTTRRDSTPPTPGSVTSWPRCPRRCGPMTRPWPRGTCCASTAASSTAAGIGYDDLPRPAGADELEAERREQARQRAREHAQHWREQQYRQAHTYLRCDADGGQVTLAFPYDPDLVAACRDDPRPPLRRRGQGQRVPVHQPPRRDRAGRRAPDRGDRRGPRASQDLYRTGRGTRHPATGPPGRPEPDDHHRRPVQPGTESGAQGRQPRPVHLGPERPRPPADASRGHRPARAGATVRPGDQRAGPRGDHRRDRATGPEPRRRLRVRGGPGAGARPGRRNGAEGAAVPGGPVRPGAPPGADRRRHGLGQDPVQPGRRRRRRRLPGGGGLPPEPDPELGRRDQPVLPRPDRPPGGRHDSGRRSRRAPTSSSSGRPRWPPSRGRRRTEARSSAGSKRWPRLRPRR